MKLQQFLQQSANNSTIFYRHKNAHQKEHLTFSDLNEAFEFVGNLPLKFKFVRAVPTTLKSYCLYFSEAKNN